MRSLSEAAAEQARALELAAEGGLGWRSRAIDEDFVLAPGMNRPGPAESWDRFDDAVGGLAAALAGTSIAALAGAFGRLSEAADALTADVQPLYRAGGLAG